MTAKAQTLDVHRARFDEVEDDLPGRDTHWVRKLRRQAIETYEELGWPTTDQEAWKYTNLGPVREVDHRPAPDLRGSVSREDLEAFRFEDLDAALAVFVNGRLDEELSDLDALSDGVRVASLARVLEEEPERVEGDLAAHADPTDETFAALNTASFRDGALVEVDEDAIAATPIHVLHVSATEDTPQVTHPRTLILADASSEATVVETFADLGDERVLTNGVTEIRTAKNATVRHVKFQRESELADHLWTFDATQARDSTLRSHNLTFGARLTRNHVYGTVGGQAADAVLNGFYFGHEDQHVDNYTRIRHVDTHGDSHQLYKGILDDESRGVFRGTIYVAPGAQRTDGYQHNPNLLLSEDAEANSVPQLEIFADDVKCSHGSTTGERDDSWLWYLRSRGLTEEAAEDLLTYAFAGEVLDMIDVEPVRDEARRLVLDRLDEGDVVRDAL
jgi:Fe-S cluster assembly protein SufD